MGFCALNIALVPVESSSNYLRITGYIGSAPENLRNGKKKPARSGFF